MDPGICFIKKNFILEGEKNISQNKASENGSEGSKRPLELDNNENSTSEKKIQKLENSNKKKNKGQNKNRPVFKEDRSSTLCKTFINGPTKDDCGFKNCVYSHNIDEYMKNKPADISETCYVYSIKGFCPRGLTCRFSKSHIDESFNNIKSEFYVESSVNKEKNGLTNFLQIRLRKYEYDFSKSKNLVKQLEKKTELENTNEMKEQVDNSNELIGCVIDDEKSKDKGKNFRDKLILSPLTTVGNLPFRRICKEYGADITCGEMACSVPLVKGLSQEWALTKRHESEDFFGVQVCGNSAQIIAQSVQLVNENVNVDFIDLNIGCPIDLIYKSGGGSALIRRNRVLETITRTCSTLLGDIPFTVKTRTGIYADKSVAHEILPQIECWGAAAVTLHGRSREQRYTKVANWKYIEECAQKVNRIPVIGNGDVLNFEDYNERKAIAPHVSSIMIGRGALIKPWIFKEIKEQKHLDQSSSERFDMLKRYTNYGLEHWGSDIRGVETTRRFLLEWLSFLYRYIPYDLIENPPQKINQRPQKYFGRDDLETLMSSANCSDWIKISEMLLGKVPDGFQFLPKHKANSY